jgi:[ribosomal protein S5]-alanine N-acetyltransferase
MTITLKKATLSDADFIYSIYSNKEFQKYYLSCFIPKSKKEAVDMVKSFNFKTDFMYMICLNDQKVGTIDFFINHKHNKCEVGYGINPLYFGQGIASKALKLLLKMLKNDFKIHSVHATSHPKNIGSIRVLEKNKFKKIGLVKDYYFSNGKYVDRFLFYRLI